MLNKGKKVQEAPVATGPGVSELLKATRERAGADLQSISQVLRIRYVYLEAIEEGRYEDLPGKTYVVGFVRAYSDYLGLDSDEIVRRFKEEIAGLESKAELVFPSPVTEQSVPGGAIILISLIILGAAYGGWYFLSSQDRSMAEMVPDLPAKFSEMVEKVKGSKDAETPAPSEQSEAESTTETTSTPSEAVSETSAQDMAATAQKAVEEAARIEQEKQAETPAEEIKTVKVEEVASAAETEAAEAVAPVEKAAEAVEEKVESVVESATSEETTEEVAATTETAAVTEEEAVTPPDEDPEPAQPQVMNEVILLKATDYAWVQVVDGSGAEQHTQTLLEGDEYQIPAVQGLILRTGNAGGLEIYVDGEKAPSVGGVGEVRRIIHLDPTKLLAGNAVEN